MIVVTAMDNVNWQTAVVVELVEKVVAVEEDVEMTNGGWHWLLVVATTIMDGGDHQNKYYIWPIYKKWGQINNHLVFDSLVVPPILVKPEKNFFCPTLTHVVPILVRVPCRVKYSGVHSLAETG